MASEFVGGALLSAYLRPALNHLASDGDIFDYFSENKVAVKLLRKLKTLLTSINVVMDDAENKHYTDEDVSGWLRDVKDAVFDVDDLLDEINTEVSMSKLMMQAESQTTTTSSEVSSPNFTSTTSLSSFDEKLPSRIQDILDNLDDLASQKDILGLVKGTGAGVGMGKNVPQRVPSTSLVDEATIYGRDDDKKVIIDLLLSEDDNGSSGNNLAVISIVGMGGMGKTTLAQLVYNDSKMGDIFQLKAWVCVSEDFDIVKVTRTILEGLSLTTNDREDLNSLQVKLKEKLRGKQFLLVLDDVWEENYLKWENLRCPFVYGARGSKILVTTRNKKVALAMRCAHPHQLKQLPEEQSWLLFAKYALFDSNSIPSFEEIGKKIIKKCNGLPLALKAIGSLLYNESTTKEWNRILTSEIWDISDSIIPALRLSYQYLPPILKRCFAYCSLIHKDYEFEKDWLVELWMAENFLPVHQQKKDMKEIGDQFFNDMLSRSFFQKSSRSYSTTFVMHDLVNDLATSISGEFCLRLEKEEDAKDVSKMTRHISYIGNSWDNPEQFEAIYKANKLRTLIAFTKENISSGIINNLLGKCKSLRVLSLQSNFDLNLDVCDNFCIGYLKHLRYLKVSTPLKKLPAPIYLLYNLQTLYLLNCRDLEELPPLGILPSLKKLSIKNNHEIKRIGGEFYGNKYSSAVAVSFPSLQFLEFHYMDVWEEWDCQNASGAFPCLQQLIIYRSPKLKNKLPEYLPSLLTLQISFCDRLVGLLTCAPKIQEIDLEYCDEVRLEFPVLNTCLETPNVEFQVSHPLNFLHNLGLECSCDYLEALPLDLFPKLKILRLFNCENLERLDGSVTSLIKLSIGDCPKLVSLPKGMQTLFPSLTQLSLKSFPEMEWPEGGLPSSLEILHINDCPKLVSFPQGMQTLFPSLTQLSLESCQEMEWPEGGLPSSLEILDIEDCPKLVASQMKWDLHNYTSLSHLFIGDGNYEMVDYKGLLPPNLKTLNNKEVRRPSS